MLLEFNWAEQIRYHLPWRTQESLKIYQASGSFVHIFLPCVHALVSFLLVLSLALFPQLWLKSPAGWADWLSFCPSDSHCALTSHTLPGWLKPVHQTHYMSTGVSWSTSVHCVKAIKLQSIQCNHTIHNLDSYPTAGQTTGIIQSTTWTVILQLAKPLESYNPQLGQLSYSRSNHWNLTIYNLDSYTLQQVMPLESYNPQLGQLSYSRSNHWNLTIHN